MTGYQILWLFLCYSFAGWILETVVATLRQRRITNRGLINGPFCIIYGISAVLITITVQELTGVALFFVLSGLCYSGRMDCRTFD